MTVCCRVQESLGQQVRDVVKDEVTRAMREHGTAISDNVLHAMRSGAVTPMRQTPDPQIEKTHILNLLRQGQLNAAFQQVSVALNTLCDCINAINSFAFLS